MCAETVPHLFMQGNCPQQQRQKRLIVCGSPFPGGKTEKVAYRLQQMAHDRGEDAELVCLSRLSIAGCRGCNRCAYYELATLGDYACVIEDAMQSFAQKLAWCDELVVVSPVFFSGSPSQLKAVYDRLQPYFWHNDLRNGKRPFDLVILGEGGDPYGFEALVSESRSALAMAGFKLRSVRDLVEKIPDDDSFDLCELEDVETEIGK